MFRSECERGKRRQGGEGEGGEVEIMCCLRNGEFLHTGQANTNKLIEGLLTGYRS